MIKPDNLTLAYTVSVRGYEFKVDFDYQPYEPMTRHYPGCDESVDICEVTDSDGDVVKDWAYEIMEDELREACLDAVHDEQERLADTQLLYYEARWEEYRLSQWVKRIRPYSGKPS
jgi:hypothetical protein